MNGMIGKKVTYGMKEDNENYNYTELRVIAERNIGNIAKTDE